jgi:hypothetical protein
LSSDSFKENHRLGVDKKATFVACSSISCNITITHADISLLKHPVLKDECQHSHILYSHVHSQFSNYFRGKHTQLTSSLSNYWNKSTTMSVCRSHNTECSHNNLMRVRAHKVTVIWFIMNSSGWIAVTSCHDNPLTSLAPDSGHR